MEDKSSGERKKLSLSLGGKLTLKNPIPSSKLPNSVTTNARSGRSTVQVEVKRTKRPINRSSLNDISKCISTIIISASEYTLLSVVALKLPCNLTLSNELTNHYRSS